MTPSRRRIVLMAMATAIAITVLAFSCSSDAADTAAPQVDLNVGDTFVYIAETNLDTVITASGPGLIGSDIPGAFLTWDPVTDTLTGTALETGTYSVTLTAVWELHGLTQTTVQDITFHVAGQSDRTIDYTLTFDSAMDDWELTFVTSVDDGQSDGVDRTGVIVILAISVVIGCLLLRVIL